MAWWALLLLVFAVWFLWVIAGAAGYAAIQASRGIPEGQRAGTSIVPVIPILPLGIWGAAMLADLAVGPWGTIVVGWLHAALGVIFIGSIGRDVWRLRSLDQNMKTSPVVHSRFATNHPSSPRSGDGP